MLASHLVYGIMSDMKETLCSVCNGDYGHEYALCPVCAEEARNAYYDSLDEDLAFEQELRNSYYDRPDNW